MAEAVEEQDLLEAVKGALEDHGTLGKFKGQLRSAVMSVLNKHPPKNGKASIPEETKLLNDLIREYLVWNGYVYSDQVLVAESGVSKERPLRKNLSAKLGVMDDTRTVKIPLLYFIISAFQSTETS